MKVLVLLSAYNGEKFLKEQIDSILNQTSEGVSLLIRDDGSSDRTAEILTSYGGKISFYSEKNIGVKASFFDLVSKAGYADYYAFSDQDDFWQPDKLKAACEMLRGSKRPALYFSDAFTADENLNIISRTHLKPKFTLGAAMVQNPAAGCTMVFNRALFDIIKRTPEPDEISMHDTWIYRLALMAGADVFFDKTPHILYRQHSGNIIGARDTFAKLRHYAGWFFKNNGFSRPYEAEKLLEAFEKEASEENVKLLRDIVNYKSSFKAKISLILGGKLKTGGFLKDAAAAAAVLTGRF